MKKLYIGFILLFGFLTFVPQVAVGDIPIILSPQEEQKLKEDKQKSLTCLNEKKAKVPSKYEGPNLKLETIPNYKFQFSSPGTNMKYYIDPVGIVGVRTKNIHYRLPEKRLKEVLKQNYVLTSIVQNCVEYITIHETNPSRENSYAYNVTNVPPNSYLKYIPETSEMQVITPTDKEYKKFMAEYKRREKRLEEERLKQDMYIKIE